MNGKILEGVLSAVKEEDRLLQLQHAELKAQASYHGKPLGRSDLENAYGQETTHALKRAEYAYEEAAKALKTAIRAHRQTRNTIWVWLWRLRLWRVGFRFSRPPVPLRGPWVARRAAFARKRAARNASWAMSLRIGAGDLAQRIAQQCYDAEYEHQRTWTLAGNARAAQATIEANRGNLATILEWGRRE